MKCEICDKTPQFGHNVSHSKRHTNRMWKPNIHKATIIREGRPVRVKICSRCLRTQNKLSGVA